MTTAPITPVVGVHGTHPVLDLAATYTVMVDELAGMVEATPAARTDAGQVVLGVLGSLHTELDELTVELPSRRHLARLAADAQALADYADEHTPIARVFAALVTPLRELRRELVTTGSHVHDLDQGGA